MSTFLRHAIQTTLALSLMGAFCFGQHYNQTNLVSNVSGVAPATDPDLINPWGMSRSSGSPWWVSDMGKGVSTLYSGAGAKKALTVTIPAALPHNQGTPTGTIFNGSKTDFLLAPSAPAIFLFCTIDGTIAGWNPASTTAVTAVKTRKGSSYTGLTSAYMDGERYLYAANFGKGRVDVYDNAFHRVKLEDDRFEDERLPRDYVPFNVQTIGNDIVVTYVLHEEGQPFETDGPGLGYVDVFTSRGELLLRLEHGDWLNAPWGVALAPLDFGRFSHDLLIGQFSGGGNTESSGYIAAYDLITGKFEGLLEDTNGKPLAINGLWSLSPGNASPNNYDVVGPPAVAAAAELYFTAGPNHGTGGLLGFLKAVPTELIQGNNQ